MEKTKPPTVALLAAIYTKLGNTTFGGGDPTMASLQRELGEHRGWLSTEQFAIAYSLARLTPGTNVLAFCAATAYLLHGWAAVFVAVAGASAPAAMIVVWLTVAFQSAQRSPVAAAAAGGVLAAVLGMMLSSSWLLVKPSLTRTLWPRVVVLTGGTLLAREWLQLSPVQVMMGAAAIAALWPEPEAER